MMKHRMTHLAIVTLAICGSSLTGGLAARPLDYGTGDGPAEMAGRAAGQAASRPASTARQGAGSLGALAGSWRVTAVLVDDTDVQALVRNDPSYMGAVLNITPQRLSWQPHKGGELSDVCDQPRLARDGLISCGKGEFGPPDTKLVVEKQTVKLGWYDGGTLVLRRLR